METTLLLRICMKYNKVCSWFQETNSDTVEPDCIFVETETRASVFVFHLRATS